jgi:ribose 5-phosphate isomerase B
MTFKVLAFGSDHAGLALKTELMEVASSFGYRTVDHGTTTPDSVDYPDIALKVVNALKDSEAPLGVLICGSGIGMSMTANRHPGIRAALCHTELEARLAREHNDANILCLGGRTLGTDQAKACLTAFLNAHFLGGHHTPRVAKIG